MQVRGRIQSVYVQLLTFSPWHERDISLRNKICICQYEFVCWWLCSW